MFGLFFFIQWSFVALQSSIVYLSYYCYKEERSVCFTSLCTCRIAAVR